jgi:hypothetical protein
VDGAAFVALVDFLAAEAGAAAATGAGILLLVTEEEGGILERRMPNFLEKKALKFYLSR